MAYFKRDCLEMFLGVVRKYMQVRGPLSQKDLAELTGVGDSTISRLLNQKTRELDPQLMATIITKLHIPLHEVIDFIEEDYGERFKKLVKYCKDIETLRPEEKELLSAEDPGRGAEGRSTEDKGHAKGPQTDIFLGAKKVTLPVEGGPAPARDQEKRNSGEKLEGPLPIKDKLERLSPRQKAYLSEFLNLDLEGRDLIVDVGNSLFRYFKQKGIEF